MLSPSEFRNLVSGRTPGMLARLLRGLLRLAEFPYTWAVCWRNRRYDRQQAAVASVSVPVISVGNLTLGGTGKTPLVQWLAEWLRQHHVRVAIVSRGYGAEQGKLNDEALELQLALPDVPHLQHPNRVAAAQTAIEKHQAQLILLDDGFQHRRLARDLDMVLLDATEPWGYDHVFPRGTLREPVTGLARAQVVVLSRADMLDRAARRRIRDRVIQLAPRAIWCEVEHRPNVLINSSGAELLLSALSGKRVAAFCGIGNPTGFLHTLESLGCEITAWREFPDHCRYTHEDIESLSNWAAQAEMVICTRKDLVKLRESHLGEAPLWALGICLRFLAGQEELTDALRRTSVS
ncbi:MAG: tetraacyldisaccharide 4'-kinase [Pirellulales bacterium]|nr:tetraacyldisaccharide 4'-kinase [Pirellulales bacterium]